MNIHFIAIGGSVMHNLAICLRKKNYNVTGSDDEIFEPAVSNLSKYDLLPPSLGWHPQKITKDLNAVILGMHARADNPELKKAQELKIPIYSFPAYVYEQIKNKQRVVIAGSHGKTTTTAMIMFVLKNFQKKFDYLVGSRLHGFDQMVELTNDSQLAILEGDEYLSSTLEKTPKFLFYKPHIATLSGIAWDHINVFPTFENYVEQFEKFVESIEQGGALIYNEEDENVKKVAERSRADIEKIPYKTPNYEIRDGETFIRSGDQFFHLEIFGKHNMQNLECARLVCNKLKISNEEFFSAMQSFTGAAKRMEIVFKNKSSALFKDFAHSPSKLKATINAVKEQFPDRNLIACMELHTFSSLNENFLDQYAESMNSADVAVVYFNKHTLKMKRLPDISSPQIKNSFAKKDLHVFSEKTELENFLRQQTLRGSNLLMMSSGTFDGLDLDDLARLMENVSV